MQCVKCIIEGPSSHCAYCMVHLSDPKQILCERCSKNQGVATAIAAKIEEAVDLSRAMGEKSAPQGLAPPIPKDEHLVRKHGGLTEGLARKSGGLTEASRRSHHPKTGKPRGRPRKDPPAPVQAPGEPESVPEASRRRCDACGKVVLAKYTSYCVKCKEALCLGCVGAHKGHPLKPFSEPRPGNEAGRYKVPETVQT